MLVVWAFSTSPRMKRLDHRWVRQVQRTSGQMTTTNVKSSVLCSYHFEESCFEPHQKVVASPRSTTSYINVSWLVEFLLYTTHISIYCCYCWLHPCPPCCSLQNNQNLPNLVANVDCTHITASFEDLVTLHRRTLLQIFRWLPLDMVTVSGVRTPQTK